VLTFADELPSRRSRVVVAGVSGSGKSTLCRQLAEKLELPYTEMDGLFHGPNWTERPEFLADVDAFTAQKAWVTEWQYAPAQPRLADRAELLVWLDLPFRLTLARVIRRTVRRRRGREVLWNGNIEAPLWTFFTDREHIVRWAISTRRKYQRLVPALEASHHHLSIVRLRSTAEVDAWVARLSPAA
jgi:adenylate kinase family enzyme